MSEGARKGEEHTTAQSFRRDPGMPFDDYRVETYCKARAKGGTVLAAAGSAGVHKNTAIKWEREPEVRARQRELREGAEDFIGVSVAWCIHQLKTNCTAAREAGAFKASNEAAILVYKIMREDKAAAHNMAAALPATTQGMDLQKRIRESFRQPDDADVIELTPEAEAES